MTTPTHHSPHTTQRPVAFGPYRLYCATAELLRNGKPVRLRRQPGRLLALLVNRPNQLVRREEIIRHLWGDRIVEYDQGLHTCVRQIREALGDSATNPTWVETVPRCGYRFIGAVRSLDDDNAYRPRTVFGGRARILTAGCAVLASMLATASQPRTPANGPRIVVEGGIPHRDLAAAITHETQLLSEIEPPHISFHQRRDTGARLVALTGATDTVLAVSLPSDPSAQQLALIARQSLAALVRDAVPVDSPPRHVRDAYRHGQFVLESHDDARLGTALDLFQGVAAQAPGYAPAHAAMAHAHLMRGEYPPARRAAQRALALDARNAAAHMTLANVALYADWNRRASAEHHRVVLNGFPGWSMAHVSYAYLLSGQGKHDQALAHARLALELDPVSPIVHGDLGLLYLLAGQFENAIVHCRRTLELEPQQWVARACLVDALLEAGDSGKARTEAVGLMETLSAPSSAVAAVRDDGHRSSLDAYWRWTLTWALPKGNRWYPYLAARAYVGLREFDTAVTTLVRAAGEHTATVAALDDGGRQVIGTAMFPALRVDPRFAPLHEDTRFTQLVGRITGG